MAVRVSVVIERRTGARLSTTAILNGGFESRGPEILLPSAAAKRIWDTLPRGTRVVPVEVATGQASVFQVPDSLWVKVRTGDREGPRVRCAPLVSDGADEILLSDTAIDGLGVRIESFARGLWRFADERRRRRSRRLQRWRRAKARS